MGGASAAYNEPMAFRLRGSLDRAALASALDALVARHEALRTRVSPWTVWRSSGSVRRTAVLPWSPRT
jgi:hypothetical protein